MPTVFPAPLKQRQSPPHRLQGFTLIELVVGIGLLAILASVVAPSMSAFVASRRVEDTARRLAEDMALARNEAVKRNATVLLCVDASVSTCAAATGSADWAKGWRVCFDTNNDDACDASTTSDTNPVRVQPAINAAVKLSGPLSRVRFNPNGTLTSTAYTNFEVSSAHVTTSMWLVRFAASGAMSVRKG
jgi:prepilin-type N-terminal cleavage/methylation domain-containing protein